MAMAAYCMFKQPLDEQQKVDTVDWVVIHLNVKYAIEGEHGQDRVSTKVRCVAIKKDMYSPCSPYKRISALCTVLIEAAHMGATSSFD